MQRRIGIISPMKNAYSETFIKAHIDKLPFKTYNFYGGLKPQYLDGFGSIYGKSMYSRISRRCAKAFFNKSAFEYSMLKCIQKHSIEGILAEYGTTGASIYPICEKAGIPLVVFFHGFDASKNSILEKYRMEYIKAVDYSIKSFTASTHLKHKLESIGVDPGKLEVNPYGPDDSFLNINPEFDSNTFLSVGRFVDKKAPYYLLCSAKMVIDSGHSLQLRMAGDGVLLEACQNLARQFGIEKYVTFPGVLSPKEVKAEMTNALAFIQHSVMAKDGDSEGTPVAVLEASAAGLPVLSTFHSGIKDVVDHEGTGLLSNEHDTLAMAQHMIKILKDRDYARKLGTAGKNKVRVNFSMEKHLNKIAEAFTKTE